MAISAEPVRRYWAQITVEVELDAPGHWNHDLIGQHLDDALRQAVKHDPVFALADARVRVLPHGSASKILEGTS